MTTVKLILEHHNPPFSWNIPYRGMNHHQRNEIAKTLHFIVKLELRKLEKNPLFIWPVYIAVVVYFSGRQHDSCNVITKFYIDGLIKSDINPFGIIPDDNPKFVAFSGGQPRVDKQQPRVEIIVTDNIYELIEEIEVK